MAVSLDVIVDRVPRDIGHGGDRIRALVEHIVVEVGVGAPVSHGVSPCRSFPLPFPFGELRGHVLGDDFAHGRGPREAGDAERRMHLGRQVHTQALVSL